MNSYSSSISVRMTLLATMCGLVFWSAAPAQAAGHGPESWRDFARRSLTPDYSWNDAPPAQMLAPDLRAVASATMRNNGWALSWSPSRASTRHSISLMLDHSAGSGAGTAMPIAVQAPDFTVRLSPLHSRLLDASYEQDLGARGMFAVTALMAQQQYATPGFGVLDGTQPLEPHAARDPRVETADGHGVRLDYRLPVGQRMAWRWSAQSRLEMNTLQSVHGIYAEPGDFDLPARLGTQVEWLAGGNLAFAVGMERVYYADITPFTSPALPARLLSLMADGSAPEFAWRDLTVYSMETRVLDPWRGEWSLRYSTRQQPSPTAALYQRALAPEYTNTNLSLGYRRGLQGWGEMRLTASYAPSMAFLGPGVAFSPRTYSRGAIGEFEASWVLPF